MSLNDQLKQAIQQLAGTHNKDDVMSFDCTVDEVREDDFECDVTAIGGNATTKVPGVRLAAEANDGWTLIPKVGSTVTVTITKNGLAYVSMFSDLDKVKAVINETMIVMEDGKITFNDGSFEGLVKVIELTEKLNNIEKAFNDLVAAYTAHVHSGGTIMGSTGTTSPFTETLTPTVQSDIENPLIIHGE